MQSAGWSPANVNWWDCCVTTGQHTRTRVKSSFLSPACAVCASAAAPARSAQTAEEPVFRAGHISGETHASFAHLSSETGAAGLTLRLFSCRSTPHTHPIFLSNSYFTKGYQWITKTIHFRSHVPVIPLFSHSGNSFFNWSWLVFNGIVIPGCVQSLQYFAL